MFVNKLTVLFLLINCVFLCLAAIPSDTTKCKPGDSECIVNTVNAIFKKKFEGDAEMGLTSLDPMHIDKMTISQGGDSPVSITLNLKDCKIRGLKRAEFYKISGFSEKPEGNKIDLRVKVARLNLAGPYDGNGKVLILPIYGKGNANITMQNMDVKMKMLTKKVEKDGKTYMAVDKFKLDFDASKLNCYFTGLFNGDKALGDNMNLFLNQNSQILLDELKPSIVQAFTKVFVGIVNKVFIQTPFEELFAQ